MRPRSGRFRLFAGTCGVLLVPLLATACGAGAPGAEHDSGGEPTVVTSIYPLTWVAERVAGDAAQVRSLASGGDPHHLELTPRQMADVQEASLVVYIGGLQPPMDEAVTQQAQGHALDAASATRTGRTPGQNPSRGPADGHGHGGDVHGHGDGPRQGHHERPGQGHHERPGHGPEDGRRGHAFDPHIWLDPLRFAAVAERLGDRLAAADPAGADAYRQRAERTAGQLRELHRAYGTALRGCDTRTLVTSHRAFGHLAQRYDLRQVSIAGLDPEVQPAPTRLTDVVRIAERRDVRTVFHDQSASAELAGVVADEAGARTAALDTVTDPPTDDSRDYLAAMRANLDTLRKGLRC